jgi:hypothetical protein
MRDKHFSRRWKMQHRDFTPGMTEHYGSHGAKEMTDTLNCSRADLRKAKKKVNRTRIQRHQSR